MTRPELFPYLWARYLETKDGRSRSGDVDLLAEAVERIEWPGTPEMGPEIARLLRQAYVGDKTGEGGAAYRTIRNQEIVGLAEIHRGMGRSERESADRIADIFGMTPDAVRKVIQRKRGDK